MTDKARETVLKVSSISKVYSLYNNKYSESIKDAINFNKNDKQHNYHTALDNISFELKEGESLGIVGPNGSGKSTLLRIIGGITKPTSGEIEVYGRCLSVLDIGTGFHPDLTGRENVYMSGEILGLQRSSIKEKLQSIYEFSELEEYFDEPVKNYSSGMYLRLAFSVIAFLEGDLMLFDETISVGDLAFRLKCRNKMEEMLRQGKTMIIVSHNLNEVISLCNKFMHIDSGKMVALSTDFNILAQYMDSSVKLAREKSGVDTDTTSNRLSVSNFDEYKVGEGLHIESVKLVPVTNEAKDVIYREQEMKLLIEYVKEEGDSTIDVAFSITDFSGNVALSSSPLSSNKFFEYKEPCKCRVECTIPKDLFNRGQFHINLYFVKNKSSLVASLLKVISFNVETIHAGEGMNREFFNVPGPLAPSFDWQLSYVERDKKA